MRRDSLYKDNGEPKRIRCYMQKRNPTFDYITVVYTYTSSAGYRKHITIYRGMSEHPCDPQGFGLMGECESHKFNPGGSRVKFSELPIDCQKVVHDDYKDIWQPDMTYAEFKLYLKGEIG